MELGEFLAEATQFVKGEINVVVYQRDENSCVIAKKVVPIAVVFPDYKGEGVKIVVEEKDIEAAEWVPHD